MGFPGNSSFGNTTQPVTQTLASSSSGGAMRAQSDSYARILEPYFWISVPCILLCIITISLNSFVIDHYRRSGITVVSLIYSLISSVDILTAVGVIYQSVVLALFHKRIIKRWTEIDRYHSVISYTLIAVSYRCSIFGNLMLAVSRTVVILNPFYRIKKRNVAMASVMYGLIWIVVAAVDIYLSFQTFGMRYGQGFGYKTYITANGMGKIIEDKFDSFECQIETSMELTTFHQYSDPVFAHCNSLLYSILHHTSRFFFIVVPFLIPVVIVLITCIVQMVVLTKPSLVTTINNQRHVTITVVAMSVLFVGCNSAFATYILLLKYDVIYDPQIDVMAVLGTLLPILNAALNPAIIICRSSELKGKFLKKWSQLRGVEPRAKGSVEQKWRNVTRTEGIEPNETSSLIRKT